MGWGRVWALALVQFGAEDIEIRILIGLGVAFLTLMIVEGLRASFRVRRAQLSGPSPATQQNFATTSRNATAAPVAKSPLQPLRARAIVARVAPKPVRSAASRHRPVKPKIRRQQTIVCKPNFTERLTP